MSKMTHAESRQVCLPSVTTNISQRHSDFHTAVKFNFLRTLATPRAWFVIAEWVMCWCRYVGQMIGSRYGAGSGEIWLDNVQCVGTETHIGSCFHNGWGVHDCSHREDVSITCTANSDPSSTTSSSSSTTTTTTASTSTSSSSTTSTPPTNGLHSEFSFSPLHCGFHLQCFEFFGWAAGRHRPVTVTI